MTTWVAVVVALFLVVFVTRRGRIKKLVQGETPLTVDAIQERLDFAKASGKPISVSVALEQVLEESREVKKAQARVPK